MHLLGSLFSYLFIGLLSLSLFSTAQAEEPAVFWNALKEGGKVVLVRHAEIDRTFGDSFLLDDSCFSEKNLNEFGRKQAQAIRSQFAKHKININKVLVSPHCRTKETAELAFGTYSVEPILRLTKALTVEQANANIAKTKELIGGYNGKGNLILVTHRPNIGELALIRVEPSEMVVLQPLGEGLFDIVSRIQLLKPE